jgi:hypothetical protein
LHSFARQSLEAFWSFVHPKDLPRASVPSCFRRGKTIDCPTCYYFVAPSFLSSTAAVVAIVDLFCDL